VSFGEHILQRNVFSECVLHRMCSLLCICERYEEEEEESRSRSKRAGLPSASGKGKSGSGSLDSKKRSKVTERD